MTYTATIKKESVTKTGKTHNISLIVIINNETKEILRYSVSEKYNRETGNIDNFMNSLRQQIKDKWNDYKMNSGIFEEAILDNKIANLQNQTNSYINNKED